MNSNFLSNNSIGQSYGQYPRAVSSTTMGNLMEIQNVPNASSAMHANASNIMSQNDFIRIFHANQARLLASSIAKNSVPASTTFLRNGENTVLANHVQQTPRNQMPIRSNSEVPFAPATVKIVPNMSTPSRPMTAFAMDNILEGTTSQRPSPFAAQGPHTSRKRQSENLIITTPKRGRPTKAEVASRIWLRVPLQTPTHRPLQININTPNYPRMAPTPYYYFGSPYAPRIFPMSPLSMPSPICPGSPYLNPFFSGFPYSPLSPFLNNQKFAPNQQVYTPPQLSRNSPQDQ